MTDNSKTTTIKAAKIIGLWCLGFTLASVCWHFGGIDYTDKNVVSGLACAMSMLVGFIFSLQHDGLVM